MNQCTQELIFETFCYISIFNFLTKNKLTVKLVEFYNKIGSYCSYCS